MGKHSSLMSKSEKSFPGRRRNTSHGTGEILLRYALADDEKGGKRENIWRLRWHRSTSKKTASSRFDLYGACHGVLHIWFKRCALGQTDFFLWRTSREYESVWRGRGKYQTAEKSIHGGLNYSKYWNCDDCVCILIFVNCVAWVLKGRNSGIGL